MATVTLTTVRTGSGGVYDGAQVNDGPYRGTLYWIPGTLSPATFAAEPEWWVTTDADPTGTGGAYRWEVPSVMRPYFVLGTGGGTALTSLDRRTLNYRSIYVDSVGGNDALEGDAPGTAIKTMARAIEETHYGSRINFLFGNPTTVDIACFFQDAGAFSFTGRAINPATGEWTPYQQAITFAAQATNSTDFVGAWHFGMNETVSIYALKLILPQNSTRSQCGIIGCNRNVDMELLQCKIVPPTGTIASGQLPPSTNNAVLIQAAVEDPDVEIQYPTIEAGRSMAGRWIRGVAAGANPQATNPLTNITQAMNS